VAAPEVHDDALGVASSGAEHTIDSLKFFHFLDHRPQNSANDSAQFLFSFVRWLSFMLRMALPDVGEILVHCIHIDVSRRPLSISMSAMPMEVLSQLRS
jgi:hypothetical protein